MRKKKGFAVFFILLMVLLFVISCEKKLESEEGTIEAGTLDMAIKNVFAIHNSESSGYDEDCIKCHGNMIGESLDESIPTAHRAMFPYVPGYKASKGVTNSSCIYCHDSVDVENSSAGNIRKSVAAKTCTGCHGPSGASEKQYYEYQ